MHCTVRAHASSSSAVGVRRCSLGGTRRGVRVLRRQWRGGHRQGRRRRKCRGRRDRRRCSRGRLPRRRQPHPRRLRRRPRQRARCLQLGAACKQQRRLLQQRLRERLLRLPRVPLRQHARAPRTASAAARRAAAASARRSTRRCSTLGNACTSSASVLLRAVLGGHLPAVVLLRAAGRRLRVERRLLHRRLQRRERPDAGHLRGLAAPAAPRTAASSTASSAGARAADGGAVFIDSGLPACGGPCCSRACAPWGPTGVLVCQPASGCHPVGRPLPHGHRLLRRRGHPGGSNKPVTCDMSGGGPVGICRCPMGCKPNGDVCKLATMSCNSSCDCCAGNCETDGHVQAGQRRRAALRRGPVRRRGWLVRFERRLLQRRAVRAQPRAATRRTSARATACVPACGACTNNADCCPGPSCEIPQGSTQGICGPLRGRWKRRWQRQRRRRRRERPARRGLRALRSGVRHGRRLLLRRAVHQRSVRGTNPVAAHSRQGPHRGPSAVPPCVPCCWPRPRPALAGRWPTTPSSTPATTRSTRGGRASRCSGAGRTTTTRPTTASVWAAASRSPSWTTASSRASTTASPSASAIDWLHYTAAATGTTSAAYYRSPPLE